MYQRIKKDTKWSIKHLGFCDIKMIKAEVSNFSDEWLLNTTRQNHGLVHTNTEMFRICSTPYEWTPDLEIVTTYENSLKTKEAQEELDKLFNYLEERYCGKVIRCEIIKLHANSEVHKHVDAGPLLNFSRRVHIPIITNKDVTFTVFNNTIHMEEFGIYEINNMLPHAVSNKSSEDRTHLIIDILPDDMLNYTKLGE